MDAISKGQEVSDLREIISCVSQLAALVQAHLHESELQEPGIPMGPEPSDKVRQIIKQLDQIAVGLDIEEKR